jgi:hypothetical protein
VLGSSNHFGRVKVDEVAHQLLFDVEASSFPNWEGKRQVRNYTYADGRLTYCGAGERLRRWHNSLFGLAEGALRRRLRLRWQCANFSGAKGATCPDGRDPNFTTGVTCRFCGQLVPWGTICA